ncbi:MAG: glycosyltransferase family 4 protein [Desulfovibrionaceae bacterium]
MQLLLIDFSHTWGVTQAHILELACALQQEQRFHLCLCCPHGSPLARKATALSVPILPLWGTGAWNPFNLLRLWLLTRAENHCLIHTFSTVAAHLGAQVQRLRPPQRTVLIHTCHTHQTLGENQEDTETLPAYWQQADIVLCGNQNMRTRLLKTGLDTRKILCLPAGVDTTALPPRASLPEQRFIIAAMTARTDTAAHSVLLKAMAALWQSENIPPWELRIFGVCPNFQSLLDEAIALGVESRLALLGPQDLREVLPHCHVLVAPGMQPHGSLPAMAAAWATGLPLICPALATNMEWAVHEKNALLYKAEDPQALATHLKRLMRDAPLYLSLADGGLHTLPTTSIDHAVCQCRALYAQCLKKNGWVLPPAASLCTDPRPNSTEDPSPQTPAL